MRKILIVDDNQDIRALLRCALETVEGFELLEASDGPAALAAVVALQPDLVLMDIMMPGAFDGLEACRRIKASEDGPVPKVILVSAKPEAEARPLAEAAGADLFVAKPFGLFSLVEWLSSLSAH